MLSSGKVFRVLGFLQVGLGSTTSGAGQGAVGTATDDPVDPLEPLALLAALGLGAGLAARLAAALALTLCFAVLDLEGLVALVAFLALLFGARLALAFALGVALPLGSLHFALGVALAGLRPRVLPICSPCFEKSGGSMSFT